MKFWNGCSGLTHKKEFSAVATARLSYSWNISRAEILED